MIQRLVPSAAAERPSRVAAYFHVTNGRPAACRCSQASSGPAATSSLSKPVTTSTPAARSRSTPPPAFAVGSAQPMTTLLIPASIRAWAQGPVRPVWLQGSSVTTAVPPRPAACLRERARPRRGRRQGAGSRPPPRGHRSASSRTAPTGGLGLVVPSTARESSPSPSAPPVALAPADQQALLAHALSPTLTVVDHGPRCGCQRSRFTADEPARR